MTETMFRWFVVAGVVIMMSLALPFRLRSQSTREPLDRRQEGTFILFTLRPVAAILWIGLIAYMISPESMAWASLGIPVWLRWSGLVVWFLALALLLWTLTNLGKNLTDTVVTRREHSLVTTGPYRWVRHPFYDAMALFVLSLALMAANWFFLLAGVVVFTLLAVRSATEERKLQERFGEPYAAYVARTGKFVPRWR